MPLQRLEDPFQTSREMKDLTIGESYRNDRKCSEFIQCIAEEECA